MVTLLLATRNRGKAEELRRVLAGVPVRILTLDRFPEIPHVKENGASFRANAVKKAVEVSKRTILPVLADDSGLEVKVLGGRPGLRSARFAGPAQDSGANNAKLLRSMAGVPPSRREARFVCWLALAVGGRLIRTFQGSCPGTIALQPSGRNGFGYDPLFIPKGYRETMAMMASRKKDGLSHRGRALAQLKAWFKTNLS